MYLKGNFQEECGINDKGAFRGKAENLVDLKCKRERREAKNKHQ